MYSSELIYENNGYIYMDSKTTIKDIIESEIISKNLSELKQTVSKYNNLNTTMEELINNLNIPVICLLISLNTFIELNHEHYERSVLLKDFIKNNNIDLKDKEKIKFFNFKKLKDNQTISIETVYKIINKDIVTMSSSTFLQIDENKNIEEIYITTNLVDDIPTRELNIELMMIDKKLNKKLINKACNTLNILSRNYRKRNNMNLYDKVDISSILSKSIESCYKYLNI